ncbi:MAG: hypothetical protein KBA26_09665, partial [Candidatus Delongbacteria bacterium]|nr:hypothetical protein [Candidatus Delongbacteria bacterium]
NSEKGGTYYFFSEGELIERVRYYARITAIDPTGLYSTPSSYLYFYIDLENNKPVVLTEPDTVAYEDLEYRYILKVFDDEMDRVRISFVQKPEGMGLDSSQIRYEMDTLYAPIIWVPSAVQLGTHRVRLNIWDQMDRVVIQEYDLKVYHTNDPPEIIRPAHDTLYHIRVGDHYSVKLECRDQDGIDSIRFVFQTKPNWLNVGAYTHHQMDYSLSLQGTPTEAAIGINRVVYRVIDDSGAIDLDSFRIAVHNQNLPPGIPSLLSPANRSRVTTTKRPTLICLPTTDPDPEDTVLYYMFEIASDSLFTNIVTYMTHVQAVQGQVQWTIQMDLSENMVYYWRVRAFDGLSLGGDYSSFFRFMINTVDDPPSLAPEILYPRSYQIFHSSDSIFFRFRNPSDPDTPLDSLRGYMFISMRQNGTILYKNDNLQFNWAGNYTEVNLSEFFQQNEAAVENQWMFWRVLVQDNSFGQASSRLDTFAVSFVDEAPHPIQFFITRKDEVGYLFGEGKLETNNNYVFFQWTPPVPPSPDPEDSITNISYKISIYNAGTGLTLIDSLFTKVDARSIYSHEDNNLVSGSFQLADNIRYRAAIQAMDKNGRLSAMTFGPYFLYNERNDAPYPPTILEIEDMDGNHVLRDTRVTLVFETPGDPDYTDSISSLVHFLEVGSDSFFNSIVYSDSLIYARIKPGVVTASAVRFTYAFPQELDNYQVYYIRIRSRDDELLFSDWSDRIWVEIQAGNRPPEKPTIIYPEPDQEITDTDLPLMRISRAVDPDGQPLHYFFRLYEVLTATYPVDSSGLIPDTTWSGAFLLSENYHYRLLVRAHDGQLYSPYDSVDFYINQEIEAPSVPTSFRIKDLKNGILSNKLPIYTWQASWDADPFDAAAIYYRIALFSSTDTAAALWQSPPITEIRYLTSESDSLAEDSSYWARIRAQVDKHQQRSTWSEPVYFKVNTQNQPPFVELQGQLTQENQVFKGIIEIRWIAYDQDEDSLSVSLEYSGDYGNSWTLLPLADMRDDSMRINDSLYLWNCNDAYTQYGEKNSRIRISVSDGTTPVSVVSPPFTIARSSGPQPKVFSPEHEQTRINFTMEESGTVSIRIYNMARKLVRRLVTDLYCQTGDHYVEWNGHDDHGSILPNRIYFIVLEKPNGKREYSSVVIMQK